MNEIPDNYKKVFVEQPLLIHQLAQQKMGKESMERGDAK